MSLSETPPACIACLSLKLMRGADAFGRRSPLVACCIRLTHISMEKIINCLKSHSSYIKKQKNITDCEILDRGQHQPPNPVNQKSTVGRKENTYSFHTSSRSVSDAPTGDKDAVNAANSYFVMMRIITQGDKNPQYKMTVGAESVACL